MRLFIKLQKRFKSVAQVTSRLGNVSYNFVWNDKAGAYVCEVPNIDAFDSFCLGCYQFGMRSFIPGLWITDEKPGKAKSSDKETVNKSADAETPKVEEPAKTEAPAGTVESPVETNPEANQTAAPAPEKPAKGKGKKKGK